MCIPSSQHVEVSPGGVTFHHESISATASSRTHSQSPSGVTDGGNHLDKHHFIAPLSSSLFPSSSPSPLPTLSALFSPLPLRPLSPLFSFSPLLLLGILFFLSSITLGHLGTSISWMGSLSFLARAEQIPISFNSHTPASAAPRKGGAPLHVWPPVLVFFNPSLFFGFTSSTPAALDYIQVAVHAALSCIHLRRAVHY